MADLTPEQVQTLRLRAQCLHSKAPCEEASEIVRTVCGVNAQLRPAMMLALRARIRDISSEDVAKLTDVQGTLVRTWAMRGTIHLLPRDDPGWMLPLIGPPAMAKTLGRRRKLGLDDKKLTKGMSKIRTTLKDKRMALTREELIDQLIDLGIEIERKSQAPYHLIAYAGLKGTIFLGPDRSSGEQTYRLATGERKRLPREEALAELAGRYLMGYGPASPADFRSWSGLPSTDAKNAWELLRKSGSLIDIAVENRPLEALEMQLRSKAKGTLIDTVVNLLPAFDTLILG
ncbi:MAG TPA: winged helix DNA-binding domain-containing protein, partial [Methanocella sp.]|nr:winged helix DNA-binding domain-containing protein [Methanocella sp.]